MFSISLSPDQFTSFTFLCPLHRRDCGYKLKTEIYSVQMRCTEFFVTVLTELQGKDLFGKLFNPGICPCDPLLS